MKTFFSHIGYIGEMKRNFHILRFQYLALAVVKLVPKNLNIIDTNTGQKERVRQINTLVQCTIEKTNIPLVLQEYRNSGDPECIAQLATADMDLDLISGKLVLSITSLKREVKSSSYRMIRRNPTRLMQPVQKSNAAD